MAYDHNGPSVKFRDAADQGRIIREAAVSMEFHEISEDVFNQVKSSGP